MIVYAVNTNLYTFDMQAFRLGILMAVTSRFSEIIFHENIVSTRYQLNTIHTIETEGKVIPLQAQCGPEGE